MEDIEVEDMPDKNVSSDKSGLMGKESQREEYPGKGSTSKISQVKVSPEKESPGKGSTSKVSQVKVSPEKESPGKGSTSKVSQVKVSPEKDSPGKGSTSKVSQVKVSPEKESPGKGSTSKVSQVKVSPEKESPGKGSTSKVSQVKVSPEKDSPGKGSTSKVSQVKVSPEKEPPAKGSTSKLSPSTLSQGKISPGKESPGRMDQSSKMLSVQMGSRGDMKSSPSPQSNKSVGSKSVSVRLPERTSPTTTMGRASLIPVKSFTSHQSKIPTYNKDDYFDLDNAIEEEAFDWENIMNDRMDRDSWTGGYGQNKTTSKFQPGSEELQIESNQWPNQSNQMFDQSGASIGAMSQRSRSLSYPETYVSETDLAAQSDLCQTFQERQNERTKRIALKMLDITESLVPSKYVLPSYQSTKYSIPVSMETFKTNRIRLVERIRCEDPHGFVLLKGGERLNQYNTDVAYNFRQEPFFHWAFGVRDPSFWGGICVRTGKSFLFVSRTPDPFSLGKPLNLREIKKIYAVSNVFYEDEMETLINKCSPSTIFLLSGMNTDSYIMLEPPILPFITEIPIETTMLYQIMSELRVIKNLYEIELIRQACVVSSDAHKFVMHSAIGQKDFYEYQLESLFTHYCTYMGGCRANAFPSVCCSGPRTVAAQYDLIDTPNDKIIKAGDLCLFNMGSSYYGYASDIACTFPVNGKFTDKQRIVYNCVLKARNRVFEIVRPGIRWDVIHIEALRAMFNEMRQEALLFGDVDEMVEADLGAVFMPHGIGHLLGIDVHDVGGYTDSTPERPSSESLKNLRTNRILAKDMVLTVEPGCYFVDKLLEEADENQILAKFINFERINDFRDFGGVRLSDVILVTEFGNEVLSEMPRTVEEVEEWMNSEPLEGGFDGDLGPELLACLCAKIPPRISQLRMPGGKIIKGICGCKDKKSSSSSAFTIHYDKSICSERTSKTEIESVKSFDWENEEVESVGGEIDEMSEERKWKVRIPLSESSSGTSKGLKALKRPEDDESRGFKPPKAAPPTRPVTINLRGLSNDSGRNFEAPYAPRPTPASFGSRDDVMVVREKAKKSEDSLQK